MQIPSDYGYVVAVAGVIGVVQQIAGITAQSSRKYYKSKEFLKNPKFLELQEQHKKLFGSSISSEGYPDMGNGRYADCLPYDQWLAVNNAQRGHYNMLESSAPVLATMLVSGLYEPKIAAGLGAVYAVARLLYSVGYATLGPNGRMVGSALSFLSSLGLYGYSIYLGIKSVA